VFPGEVLAEVEEADFHKFNNRSGAYQTIIPRLIHFFHYSQVTTTPL
jgi:hypothetical protein